MKNKAALKTLIYAVAAVLVCFALCISQVLYSFDKLITDPLYQRPSVPNNRIRILAIDEKTLAEYGNYADWSRDIPARLVETLNADPEKAPAVIAFDVMYVGNRESRSDEAFAEICARSGNVVTAVNLVYRDEVTATEEGIRVDTDHIEMVEYPYAALKDASSYGFANTYFDRDQFVRYARLWTEYEGETIWSFPAVIYQEYAAATGTEAVMPETDARGIFNFTYTGRSGGYSVLSLCDVLEGRINTADLAGCIVLVGAYAPGMQDSYNAAIQRGTQMYGVEIQANILEALMEGKTALPLNNYLYAALACVLVLAVYLALRRLNVVSGAVLAVAAIAVCLVIGKLCYFRGVVVRIIEPVIMIAALYLLHLAIGYLAEILKRRRILAAFQKYVAPQVVREVAEKGDFEIRLGGEKRHIAVLFVDIRGFTPMSEGLAPEQVVEILNEYLALTTSSIFKNNGTLDKFIGDATMAVFNAPFDLDDYVYRAVCTARDIAAGSADLEKKLMDRFGRTVSFGIGVNCGDAVVGNIGCDFRMDYTAIGDTVNTAARLEANAKRGQILISEAVYEAVKDRVRVTEVGVIPLKGKSNEVFVYQVDEVL